MQYNWNWRIFWEMSPDAQGTYLGLLLAGAKWTIAAAFLSFFLAFVLGSAVGLARAAGHGVVSALATGYVELFRNIPLIVQLFLWFFVLPELLPTAAGTWMKQLPNAPFVTTVVCLGFFTSSRVAEQVRAGLLALPRGQLAAARALGLNGAQAYRYVALPMTYRIVLPTLTSEFLNNLKNSSVGLTIGFVELTAQARAMQEFSFQVFEAFTAATLIYLGINLVVTALALALEKWLAVPGLSSKAR